MNCDIEIESKSTIQIWNMNGGSPGWVIGMCLFVGGWIDGLLWSDFGIWDCKGWIFELTHWLTEIIEFTDTLSNLLTGTKKNHHWSSLTGYFLNPTGWTQNQIRFYGATPQYPTISHPWFKSKDGREVIVSEDVSWASAALGARNWKEMGYSSKKNNIRAMF